MLAAKVLIKSMTRRPGLEKARLAFVSRLLTPVLDLTVTTIE